MSKVFLFCLATITACHSVNSHQKSEKYAILETSMGKITIKLLLKETPNTCENFMKLTQSGFYNGLIFHRVVKGHVIQSGCPKGDGNGDAGYKIKAEFNKTKHIVGTVGMARDKDPDSASSQFYICLAPRPHLDEKYTVFGQVVEGFNVLEAIGNVEVIENWIGDDKKIAYHKPKNPVYLVRATITETPSR
jgi:cyclophilin family peptidyl-prolyl cis-trans isomerase